jgi:hypothetical protein
MASTAQSKALNRLIRKLSAIRTTLRKDERELLDQLLVGKQVDVSGHAASMDAAVATGATMAASTRHNPKAQGRVYQAADTAVATGRGRKTPAVADEVVGHAAAVDAISTGATMAASTRHNPKAQGRVYQAADTAVATGRGRKTPAVADEVMGHAANISQPKGLPAADTGATMGAVARIDYDPDSKSYRINL